MNAVRFGGGRPHSGSASRTLGNRNVRDKHNAGILGGRKERIFDAGRCHGVYESIRLTGISGCFARNADNSEHLAVVEPFCGAR